ncbi:MAG: hypothetical protein GW760_08105 [Legionella sp.]|jgi:hypothetical protein|nr:hypothetical protein [Legionella sp.]
MEFKALSHAIAHVIHSYHAHQTRTPLVPVDLNASFETIEQILNDQISEATTGSNSHSSRGTLLEYMLVGIKLCERARVAETPDEIEAVKLQLVQFFQNIQLLFKGPYLNMFTGSTLFIPADETNHFPSLSLYYLNSPTSKAYQLTHELLITLGLSPESTAATVEKHIGDLFFAKNNQVFLDKITTVTTQINDLKNDAANKNYEEQIQIIKDKISQLENLIDERTNNKAKTTAHANEDDLTMDTEVTWEVIPLNTKSEEKDPINKQKNIELQERYIRLTDSYHKLLERSKKYPEILEALQNRSEMLQNLLKGLPKEKNKKTLSKNNAHVVTEQPKAVAVAAAASRDVPASCNYVIWPRQLFSNTSMLTKLLFSPQSNKTDPDPSLDKFNKIN